MQARSALFDVYGDHLRSRDGQAPVAGLIRLLAPLEIAAPAVRTAISRMVREGWLEPCRVAGGPGYALTGRGQQRLDDAAARVYRSRSEAWDGRWHLLVIEPLAGRSTRQRLRAALAYLGYAPLGGLGSGGGTWIAPRPSAEVSGLLAAEGARAEQFVASSNGDAAGLMRRAWDVDGLAAAYQRWVSEARSLVADVPSSASASDEEAYAARSRLVHEWRKFLFQDPGLPRELLPSSWPGDAAAAYFDAEAARLAPAANRYVDACLEVGS